MTERFGGPVVPVDGDVGWVRGAARRTSFVGLGLSLALAVLGDLYLREPAWPLALSFAVGGLALVASARAGSPARAPAATAVAGSLVGTALFVVRADHDFSLFELGSLLVLLVVRWRVARRSSDWVLATGLIVALLVMPLRSAVSEPDVAAEYAGTGLAMLLVVSLAVAVATTLRNQDTLRLAAVTAVRRGERAEIARELHDVVAHHVTGIVVATQAARTVAADGTARPVDAAVAAIQDSGSQALGAMRRLVGVLRSDGGPGAGPLSPMPVLSDLDELVRRLRATGAADEVDLDLLLDRDRLAPELQAAVHRVVHEALTNVSRHAFGAARVRVAVTAAGGVLEVEVTNSAGRPASPSDTVGHGGLGGLGGGFGVIGMRERAQALGGHLAAGPRPDGGWTVLATIPLPLSARDDDGEPAVPDRELHGDGGSQQGGTRRAGRSVARLHAAAAEEDAAVQPRGGTPRAVVVGVGVVLGAFAVGDLDWPGSFWWWPLTYLAVSGLALTAAVWRGRATRPLAAAAVAGSLVATALFFALEAGREYSLLEAGALLVLLVNRWRVAREPGDRAIAAGTVVALLALPLRPAPEAIRPYDTGFQLVIEVLVVMTGVAVAVAVATALRNQDALRVAAVTAVRRGERVEIARELHDVVAHHVTGIVVATQAARTVAPSHADTPLAAIEDSGSQALGAMRRLVGVLRSEVAPVGAGTGGSAVGPRSPAPTMHDLDDLVRRFRDTGAADEVDLDLLLDRDRLAPELQAAVHRVVHEALTNVSRHASGAARVRVAVTAAGGVLEIEVTNSAGHRTPGARDTVPGGLAGVGGTGLVGMRERAQVLGGHLTAGPRRDGGWTVHVAIPLPPAHPDLLDAERSA